MHFHYSVTVTELVDVLLLVLMAVQEASFLRKMKKNYSPDLATAMATRQLDSSSNWTAEQSGRQLSPALQDGKTHPDETT